MRWTWIAVARPCPDRFVNFDLVYADAWHHPVPMCAGVLVRKLSLLI